LYLRVLFADVYGGKLLRPRSLPRDCRELDWEEVEYAYLSEKQDFVRKNLGAQRCKEIVEECRADTFIVAPSTEQVQAMKDIFIRPARESMFRAVSASEFGKLALAAVPPTSMRTLDHGSGTSKATKVKQGDMERLDIIANADCRFTMTIRFLGDNISPSRAGRAVWSIGAAIESVGGVAVEIDSWGTGSLWAKIRVHMRSVWQRDQVQEILEKGRQATESYYLDKPIAEARKLEAEYRKLDEERALLEKEMTLKPSDQQGEELMQIEIESKREDIKAKKLDNAIKEMQAIEKASDLIREGIVVADKVEIDIDGVCAFLFDGKRTKSNPIVLEDKKGGGSSE